MHVCMCACLRASMDAYCALCDAPVVGYAMRAALCNAHAVEYAMCAMMQCGVVCVLLKQCNVECTVQFTVQCAVQKVMQCAL